MTNIKKILTLCLSLFIISAPQGLAATGTKGLKKIQTKFNAEMARLERIVSKKISNARSKSLSSQQLNAINQKLSETIEAEKRKFNHLANSLQGLS